MNIIYNMKERTKRIVELILATQPEMHFRRRPDVGDNFGTCTILRSYKIIYHIIIILHNK